MEGLDRYRTLLASYNALIFTRDTMLMRGDPDMNLSLLILYKSALHSQPALGILPTRLVLLIGYHDAPLDPHHC